MRNPPFRVNDAPRQIATQSDRPVGFLRTLKQQARVLEDAVHGLELRLSKHFDNGEPAAIVARRTFRPETGETFNFDYLQNGVTSVPSNYVLRDGVTYSIPIIFPPPGVMVLRFMKVRLFQRLFVAGIGPMEIPMNTADYAFRASVQYQTKKYSFPDNASLTTRAYSRRVGFFWNLLDMKSNWKLSDELLPDLLLLPQAPALASSGANADDSVQGLPAENTGDYFEFPTPWPFERDGQASFEFRPITPVIQPTPTSGYTPYAFDDREYGGAVRDSSVTVEIDLVGTRYHTMQDALKHGANMGRHGGVG